MSTYQAIYQTSYNDMRANLQALREQAQAQYDERVYAGQKKRQPQARTIFNPLPEEVATEIRNDILNSPLGQEILQLDAELGNLQIRRENLLDVLAPEVEFKPDGCMHRLKIASSHTYSSQGYGAKKYARGELLPLVDRLEVLGFTAHVRTVNERHSASLFSVDHADFELWADCEPWMFDAMVRTLSLTDAVASMKQRALNPLVYNPFLPGSCRL